jgi:undecaprenyl-diphosphatase
MNISPLQALVLGIIQGATEFIPVSSSGHLVLIPWALGWPSPGLIYDTLVHWGTLLAVISYFWRDLVSIVLAWFKELPSVLIRREWPTEPNACLGWWLLIGTIPAVAIGAMFEDLFITLFSAPSATATLLLVTAATLALSERLSTRARTLNSLSLIDAILIGLAQAAAIAPGISRSGATISAGLGRGLRREAAARFSFLLSVPIILGAGLLPLGEAWREGTEQNVLALLAGFIAAAITGYVCIHFLLNHLRQRSLYIFAAYCAVIGIIALIADAFT